MYALDDELLALRRTFYEEADERLSEVEGLLLDLERRPDDPDLLNTIFRAVHSVKGGAAACEHTELASFAHAFESLLACLRKGQLAVTGRLLDVLLNATDVLKSLLASAKQGTREGDAVAVERSLNAIRGELAQLPTSEEASGPKVDLSPGLVIWDDEPATPVITTNSPRAPAFTSTPAASDSMVVQRIKPASLEVDALRTSVAASAPPSVAAASESPYTPYTRSYPPPPERAHTITVPPPDVQVAQVATHGSASERRSDAAPARSHAPVDPHGDYPLEAVLVRLGDQLYGLPTSHVEAFLQPDAAALREVPLQGTLLVTDERGLLPLARLEVLLGHAPDPMPIDQRVAVVVNIASRRCAVLVDEVLTQGPLLVKRIEPNFRDIPGVTGAALVGENLALVLSLERLLAPPS